MKVKTKKSDVELKNQNECNPIQEAEVIAETCRGGELAEPLSKERILSIDRFRGICMFCLVISGFMGIFPQLNVLAVLFSHDAAVGFNIFPGVTFADMFAPYFIFIVGLSAVISYNSNLKKTGSKSRTYAGFYIRYTGIIGFGWVVDGVKTTADKIGDFASLVPADQLLIVTTLIALVLFVAAGITFLFKNKNASKIAGSVFRLWIAFLGLMCTFMAIVDIGIVLGGTGAQTIAPWDVLQTIGAAGLVALPFLAMSKKVRLFVAAVITLGIALVINNGGLVAFQTILNGGLLGSLGWGAIMLFGTVMYEYRKKPITFIVLTICMLAIAYIMVYGFDLVASKRGATAPYVLFTAGTGSLIWGLLNLLNRFKPKFAFFTWWGGSALFVYLAFLTLQFVLEAVLPFEEIELAGAIIIPLLVTALFTLANFLLFKKSKHIKL